jgi:predicted PurR-regulated permease PerM
VEAVTTQDEPVPEQRLPEGSAAPAVPEAPEDPDPVRDRDSMPGWVPRAILLFFLAAAGFYVGRWLFAELSSLLMMLLISLFLSFAIEPAVNWLAAKGWRRGSATWLVFLGLMAVTAVFVGAIGTVLVGQLTNFLDSAPEYLEEIEDWVNERFDADLDTDELVDRVTEAEGPLQDWATGAASNVLTFATTVVGGLFQFFTVLLFTWYLVADGPRLRRALLSTQPVHRQHQVLRTWELAIEKTGGYIYSRTLLAGISAVTTWAALALLDVPYPVPLALWVGVMSQFVPVVGTYLAGSMPVLVALLNDPPKAIAVLAFIVVYQQVENYFLAPRITARTMELHPAVAFGTVIAGAALVGPIGAVLALPAAAVIQAFISAFVDRHEVVHSALTAEPARSGPRRWVRIASRLRRTPRIDPPA